MTRKRRGPALGNRPSHDSTTTTALDGLSLSLSKQWIPYDEEDLSGDFLEPPEIVPIRVIRAPDRECGCVLLYGRAA
jgi:hypothetical protein